MHTGSTEQRRLRIFYVCGDNLSIGGGGVTHILETLRPIAHRKNRIILYAPKKGKLKNPPANIEIRYVYSPFSGVLSALAFNIFLFINLCLDMGRNRPDIIHTRQLPYSFAPLLAAKIFGVTHYLEVNGIHYDELKIIGTSKLRLLLIHFFSTINFSFSDSISVTVEESRHRMEALYKIPAEKIQLIPCNAANHHVFRPGDKVKARNKLNLNTGDFIIGYVGSLYSWHGVDRLIASVPLMVKRIPNLKIVIVGDGSELQDLEKLAQKNNVEDTVHFAGMVPYDKIPTFIQAFDMAISFFKPTRPVPGIPMKIYEYMACACPVVASNVKGYGPLVEELKAGLSTDSEQIDTIAQKAIILFQNPEQRVEMGMNGRRAVEKELNWDRVSINVENLIRHTISHGK